MRGPGFCSFTILPCHFCRYLAVQLLTDRDDPHRSLASQPCLMKVLGVVAPANRTLSASPAASIDSHWRKFGASTARRNFTVSILSRAVPGDPCRSENPSYSDVMVKKRFRRSQDVRRAFTSLRPWALHCNGRAIPHLLSVLAFVEMWSTLGKRRGVCAAPSPEVRRLSDGLRSCCRTNTRRRQLIAVDWQTTER